MSDRESLRQRLGAGLAALNIRLDDTAIARLLDYVELLERWNATYNLTAVRDPAEMVTRHLLDSLAIVPYVSGKTLADLGTGAVELAVDGTENSRLYWSSARDTLAAAQAGTTEVIFPTLRNLERLAQYDDFTATAAHAAAHPVSTITPWAEEREGVVHLMIPDGMGYPVTAGPRDAVKRGNPDI